MYMVHCQNQHVDTVSSLIIVSCFLSAYWITFPLCNCVHLQSAWMSDGLFFFLHTPNFIWDIKASPVLCFKCTHCLLISLLSPWSKLDIENWPLLAICSILVSHVGLHLSTICLSIIFVQCLVWPGFLYPDEDHLHASFWIWLWYSLIMLPKKCWHWYFMSDQFDHTVFAINITQVFIWDLVWPYVAYFCALWTASCLIPVFSIDLPAEQNHLRSLRWPCCCTVPIWVRLPHSLINSYFGVLWTVSEGGLGLLRKYSKYYENTV